MGRNRSWDDLPEECWELVFSRLNQKHYKHLKSVSILNKRFLSLSNRLRTTLTITYPLVLLYHSISPILRRFHQVKKINVVQFEGNLDQVILEISQSDLSLESLNISKNKKFPKEGMKVLGLKMTKSLKSLICSRLRCLSNSDVNVIADHFPNLEEVDISYPVETDRYSSKNLQLVKDEAIKNLVSNLRSLCKLNLSWNRLITDSSLFAISTCENLTEFGGSGFDRATQNGISLIMRYCPNLTCLELGGFSASLHHLSDGGFFAWLAEVGGFAFQARRNGEIVPYTSVESAFVYTKALRDLRIYDADISDEFLSLIVSADIPLQKLRLSECRRYTFDGIYLLLRKYSGLAFLDLRRANFLSDDNVVCLSPYIHHLTYINLSSCSNLTSSTFFTLAKDCPFIEEIQMSKTGLGKGDLNTALPENLNVRNLNFGCNKYLNDETLAKLVSVCPKVRSLDLSACEGIKNLGWDVMLLKLKVLNVGGSGIDDEGMERIGETCCGLVCLDLTGCFGITRKGMTKVLKQCRRLKEVNLRNCRMMQMTVEIMAWMVSTRPSLTRIAYNSGLGESEVQKNALLRNWIPGFR